jgi:hypothetical protein
MSNATIFVLGAGFTRAFISEAPLLSDPYPLGKFLETYPANKFPHAHKILSLESERAAAVGRFDLERLMTRLDSSMPHDFALASVQLVDQLRHELHKDFVERLMALNPERKIPYDLEAFARTCVIRTSTFITFNYDDFLDQALWEVTRHLEEPMYGKYWHPKSGYGFYCPPAEATVEGNRYSMGHSSTLLLKLHGSINWRVKRGAARPYQLDTILHDSSWCASTSVSSPDPERVERHLDPLRLLVLPVLIKSDLTNEPCFRLLWSEAYRRLQEAVRVIFIGYSMPRTDIAAACLFGEALQRLIR